MMRHSQVKNIFPNVPASEDNGELRTLTQLVLDICEVNGLLHLRSQGLTFLHRRLA